MPRADLERQLERAVRRRRRTHAAVASAAALLAVAATAAVRYELAGGAANVVIRLLEFVFITGIIPLIVIAIYHGASAVGEHRLLERERELPEARVRRLL